MSERPVEKSVHELCLVCRGERWLPEPLDAARSRPCPHCRGEGWVRVSPACLPENEPESEPDSRAPRKG